MGGRLQPHNRANRHGWGVFVVVAAWILVDVKRVLAIFRQELYQL